MDTQTEKLTQAISDVEHWMKSLHKLSEGMLKTLLNIERTMKNIDENIAKSIELRPAK